MQEGIKGQNQRDCSMRRSMPVAAGFEDEERSQGLWVLSRSWKE